MSVIRVFYENNVANKLIVSAIKPFANLPDEQKHSFDNLFDLSFSEITSTHVDATDIYLISTTAYSKELLDNKLPKFAPYNLYLVIKDSDIVETHEVFYKVLNWYIFWSGLKSFFETKTLNNDLLTDIFNGTCSIPTLTQRRLMCYFTSVTDLPTESFLKIFDENIQSLIVRGKTMLDNKRQDLIRALKNSRSNIITASFENNEPISLRCTWFAGNDPELVWRTFDKTNSECIALMEFNLKDNLISIKLYCKNTNVDTIINKTPLHSVAKSGCISHYTIKLNDLSNVF